ncbi:MAG: flavin-containing monooxygenase [Candidatus Binatia bacterium]
MEASHLDTQNGRSTTVPLDHEVVIVGSGFSGIGVGIKLKKVGIHNFVILEKAGDLGGTWRDNTYPGFTVDIPALTYSYSFEQNPNWSNLYAPQAELLAYAHNVTTKYDIRRHIQFNQTVKKAVYDEAQNIWTIHLEGGKTLTTRYVVRATGFLPVPKMPDIEGIGDFQGKTMHTAKWDHTYDLTGKRVGFIGTGATGIQAIPEIAPIVKSLDVYQRTAIWLLPKNDLVVSERMKKAFQHIPGFQYSTRLLTALLTDLVLIGTFVRYTRLGWFLRWLEKQCIAHIRNQVKDPAIQEKFIPPYNFGCKRPSFTNKFYPVFNQENVELVTDSIARVTPKGIVTADGKEREIDALICGTGFSTPFDRAGATLQVFGKGGKELTDFWEDNRYQAFMGATVPNFPNFFLLFGPYSVCSGSYFGMIENQSRHLVRCLQEARKRKANYIEVKQDSHDKDFQEMLSRVPRTVFGAGSCALSNSYYFNRHGDSPFIRPSSGIATWWQSHFFSMNHYHFTAR